MLGGQVHLVAWKRDLIKCAGLVAWDVGRGSHFLSLRQRAEESQRGTNSMAATGARKCRALRFTLSFCATGVVQTSGILIPLSTLASLSVSTNGRSGEVHKVVNVNVQQHHTKIKIKAERRSIRRDEERLKNDVLTQQQQLSVFLLACAKMLRMLFGCVTFN